MWKINRSSWSRFPRFSNRRLSDHYHREPVGDGTVGLRSGAARAHQEMAESEGVQAHPPAPLPRAAHDVDYSARRPWDPAVHKFAKGQHSTGMVHWSLKCRISEGMGWVGLHTDRTDPKKRVTDGCTWRESPACTGSRFRGGRVFVW